MLSRGGPLVVMFLFQLYNRLVQTNIPQLLPLMVAAISVPGPEKTVSFLIYLLKIFADYIRPHEESICKSIVNLLITCSDYVSIRKVADVVLQENQTFDLSMVLHLVTMLSDMESYGPKGSFWYQRWFKWVPVVDWQGGAIALNVGSKSSRASTFFLPLERVPCGPAHNKLESGDVSICMNNEVTTQFLKKETLLDNSVDQNIDLELEKGRLKVMCTEGDATTVCGPSCRVIEVPLVVDYLQHVVNIVPLHLLAYHLTVLRGYNVDQPTNLAKSVTAE
ncbi:unnamed protein product [Lactuca saligna]|uniref:Uncharacterized protein n=1 Tax=Lactuca saligna TaxID=75948 RepID=A0AA36A0I2_LACSI|nr:unnamed protein product [Lactuca saligna]